MIEKRLEIQTIFTKWTDFQTDPVLVFEQVSEIKEKVNSSQLLNFPFAESHCIDLVLPETQADPSKKQKSVIFANAPCTV